jgi:hypothetical protein
MLSVIWQRFYDAGLSLWLSRSKPRHIFICLLSLSMAAYFQKIPDEQFDFETDFVVKESKNMNLVVGIFFLIFSLAAFFMSVIMGGLLLLFAIGTLMRSSKDILIMKISKTGFYYYDELITDWDHFISEEFIDDGPASGRSGAVDRFYLMVKYYKDGQPGYYGRKIRLTNDQDKSEEEIIAAVKFYYKNSQKAVT